MKKLVSRVIGCAVVLSIVATYFCACNFHFIADEKIKDSVLDYWSGIRSEDIELQNTHIVSHTGGFSADSLGLSSYEKTALESALLEQTYCNFETENAIVINGNDATVTVNVITFDYVTAQRRPKKLDSLVNDLNLIGTTMVPMEINLVKVDKEWLIKDESANAIKEYFKSIPEGFEFYGVPEALALDFVQNLISDFQNGNAEGSLRYLALRNTIDSYPEEYRDAIKDSYITILSSYFGTSSDFTYSIVENTDDTVSILVEGSIVDTEAAWNDFYENDEDYLALITDSYRYIYGAYDISEYAGVFATTIESCFGACEVRTDFSRVFPIKYNEDGELTLNLDDLLIPNIGFQLDTNNENYLALRENALETLLEEETITQRQYNEAMGITSSGNANGVDFSYEENDEIYSCNYSIVENRMVRINLVTWHYYEEGTTFNYEVYKDGELISEDASYVIPKDHCDEIYPEYLFDSQEDDSYLGNYVFVVYKEDGETILTRISVTLSEDETEVVIPDIPSSYTTGESMTYEGDSTNDIYYVHFENLINDQPSSFNSGDDGFDIYVCTWRYYNDGDSFVYAVYLNGELQGAERMAYVNEREGLDRIELIYLGDEETGLQVGDYTIVLYNNNSSDVLLVAYLSVN